MPQVNILKAYGLYTYPNTLGDVPEGAMAEATNVVIDRNHVIEPRRGYKTYGPDAGSAIKQLLSYKDRLLRHFGTTLDIDVTGTGTFGTISTSVTEQDTTTGLRIKSTEANSNLYFTSSTGVRKLSAASNSAFTTTSVPALVLSGGIKAVDIDSVSNSLASGTSAALILTAVTDYQVAYRVVWGYRDANNNLILGVPSQRMVVSESEKAAGSYTHGVRITVPPEINSSHFFQLYRTKHSTFVSTVPASQEAADPGDEMYLVDEVVPATTPTVGSYIDYLDVSPDNLLGAFLYTNANSGEGITQANDPPPYCKDVASFKNSVFFANTRNRHRKFISIVGLDELDIDDTLTISDGNAATTYHFKALEATGSQHVALTTSGDPEIAIDLTARSLVRVINRQATEFVNAFYISGPDDFPGQILLERRDLTDSLFFVYGSTYPSGATNPFNPEISAGLTITATTVASPTEVTTSAHSLSTGDKILIYGTTGYTPVINGAHTVTVTSSTTFTIPVAVTTNGSGGFVVKTKSDAEEAKNRVYFSKFQQPESVPIVNYLDMGPKDKAILRIVALRDSLFAFKEEAIYRISGDSAFSFSAALFDSSANLAAPDSAVALNNLVYMLSDQGIATVSDTGVGVISRPIENLINRLKSYSAFISGTFGITSESDRSYLLNTLSISSDSIATQAFRFNTFTQSWTKWDISKKCGLVMSRDNKMYFGCADGFVEQERKDFTRLDHADRETEDTISAGSLINPLLLQLASTADIDEGDVIVQTQNLTIADYHRILRKLDIDPSVSSTNYYSLLNAEDGDNLRDKLDSLAAKLNVDLSTTDYDDVIAPTRAISIISTSTSAPTITTGITPHNLVTGDTVVLSGTNSTPTINGTFIVTVTGATTFTVPAVVTTAGSAGTVTEFTTDSTSPVFFTQLQMAFNVLATKLNADGGVFYSNYSSSSGTVGFEVTIMSKNDTLDRVTLRHTVPLIVGPMVRFKRIATTVVWAPQSFGDSVTLKQVREGSVYFESNNFHNAVVSYSSDLQPGFEPIMFNGGGTGVWGFFNWGEENWGGDGTGAPFRTYIPQQKQRCRFIHCRFQHINAIEQYAIFGIGYTAEVTSTRAYR